MGKIMVELAANIWADGPTSDPYEPDKAQIRAWGTWVEGLITDFTANGGLIYDTRAELYADTSFTDKRMAWVIQDPTVAYNGVYGFDPATDVWDRKSDLPFSFIIANDAGAGTPNAIQATTAIPVSGAALVWMNVADTTTASPVTVSFNGGSPLTIKTNSGNNVEVGGLTAGMIVMGIVSGLTFRLVSDQASAAVLAACEAAAAAALSAVPNSFPATRPALKAIDTTTHTSAFLREAGREGQFVWKSGDYSSQIAADTQEGIYIKADAVAATVGAWVRVFDGEVNAKWYGAKGDGTDDLIAVRSALASGFAVYFPEGTYGISDLVYPSQSGQVVRGAGIGRTIITNTFNNNPLFIFGNPQIADGAAQWARVESLTFKGNPSGATLWGVFIPNAAFVDGVPNTAGQYEGVSNNSNNYYFGQLSFTPAEWTIAARGCSLKDVRIETISGGYELHISAWGYRGENVQLFSGLRGLRESGAANSNTHVDYYISGMQKEAIIHPDVPNSIPTVCSFVNCVVQQCGLDDGGKGSIALYKGQETSFISPYLERNNEKGGTVDIFVGVAEIGCSVKTFRHRADTTIPKQTIIVTEGQGTLIVGGAYAVDLNEVVRVQGSDSRTRTTVIGPVEGVGSPALTNGVVNDISTGLNTSTFLPDRSEWGIALNKNHRLYKSTGKVALAALNGIGTSLALESQGSMSFSVDTANVTTGGSFTWNHNGLAGAGTLLLTLQASNGNLFPGADGTQNLGNASFRYATVFAATGTINTSDERDKTDVAVLSEAERLVALRLKGLMRRYRFRDAYDVKGENARVHVGIIAQDVVKAFEAEGLSAHDYGMLCFDSWEEAPELRDDDGNIVQDFTPAGDRFGVRYDELLAFIVAAI
ncbi:hypothetical protein GOD62_28270 [Sinorhizobium medicae]|nr:hypothetical protein [Sinorhizobium medicae]MDX0796509.1 hypothetical protein [Sinorhizobium medicae]